MNTVPACAAAARLTSPRNVSSGSEREVARGQRAPGGDAQHRHLAERGEDPRHRALTPRRDHVTDPGLLPGELVEARTAAEHPEQDRAALRMALGRSGGERHEQCGEGGGYTHGMPPAGFEPALRP